MSTLDDAQIDTGLRDLPGWSREGSTITKEYTFGSFPEAIAFINRIAEKAEAADHHPDLENHYNRVIVSLSTHSAGGVTQKDLDMARDIESVT